ncbi:MAG: hypothetical protein AB9891_00185 [Anaerolineaceae bacterium]
MGRTILVGLGSGILFGVLDALINANPLAQRLLGIFKPITRTNFNPAAAIAIDLVYGLVMAWLFLLLYPALPGGTVLGKGLAFGLLVWFFRVVMSAAAQWVMFAIPVETLLYTLAAGLVEMLLLGLLYGILLRPN